MKAVLALAFVAAAHGHGTMVKPTTWFDAGGKFGQGLAWGEAGCTGKAAPGQLEKAQGCAGEWYTNATFLPDGVEPTIARDSPLRTYMDFNFHKIVPSMPDEAIDWTTRNPWRAPGQAKIYSPCGIDGGNPDGCPKGNKSPEGCAGGGYAFGPDALKFEFKDVLTTTWKAGSVAEVAWGIVANHGGGYGYRLCKLPAAGKAALTEECFQAGHLDFVGDQSWAQLTNSLDPVANESAKIPIKAMRTSTGTFPKNSMWTKNPIPACMGPGSASAAGRGEGATKLGAIPCSEEAFFGSEWTAYHFNGTQFEPPLGWPGPTDVPPLYGFGTGSPGPSGNFQFTIVDQVQVPKDLSPGDYVLSFRYDCEQTSQVWNSCANIKIE